MNYQLAAHLRDLQLVIQKHTEWFMQVTRRIHYPNTTSGIEIPEDERNACFTRWLERARTEESVDEAVLKDLERLHKDLDHQAQRVLQDTIKTKQVPMFQDFDRLALYFEEFINRIRRIEKDCLLESSGLDVLTGLRNQEAMRKDLVEEMERYARQGKSFVIALIRIDDYPAVAASAPQEVQEKILVDAAEIIKKTMRSFDDAYRLEDGYFLLALKQTTADGGMKALLRLKADAVEFGGVYPLGDGASAQLTLSGSMVEPVPADNIDDLLESLRHDLATAGDRHGAILQYQEQSALMRYIKNYKE